MRIGYAQRVHRSGSKDDPLRVGLARCRLLGEGRQREAGACLHSKSHDAHSAARNEWKNSTGTSTMGP